MRQIIGLLGWVRLVVSLVTVASVAVAAHAAGADPVLNLCGTGLLALVLVRAPFGARYRKNF